MKPDLNTLLLEEMLGRKGTSIAKVKRWKKDPPWYMRLTWDEAEERDYKKWWVATVRRATGYVGKNDWLWWSLMYGLHRKDLCDDCHCGRAAA